MASRPRWGLPLVVFAALALVLAACGSGGESTAKRHGSTSKRASTTTTTRALLPEAWEELPAAPRELGKYAVWTGSEYLGGPAGCCDDLGGTEVFGYSPTNRTWRTLAPFPLGGRSGGAAVWTGREMIVVGGIQARSAADRTASNAVPTATGAALDPVRNTWRTITPMPAPMGSNLDGVWTGSEVVVFDTTNTTDLFHYDPATDRWTRGAAIPFRRYGTTTVWSGREVLVWGGWDTRSENVGAPSEPLVVHADGAAYDPATNRWRSIPPAPVPARAKANAVWTGRQMILWGGGGSDDSHPLLGQGAAYDPTTNTWTALPASPLKARGGHQMVWTGREVLVWGGHFQPSSPDPRTGYPRDGAAYDPATNTWRRMPTAPPSPPSLLTAFSAVWTGDVALFVGGADQNVQGVGPLGLSYAPGR